MIRQIVVGTLALLASAVLIQRYCIRVLVCNRAEAAMEQQTLREFEIGDPIVVAPSVRRRLQAIDRCLETMPTDVQFYMLAGANYRLVTRYDEAKAAYMKALQHDRRPEIFLNLGQTLIAAGRREEGMTALLQAARFYADEGMIDYVMSDIPEREEVKARLRQQHK